MGEKALICCQMTQVEDVLQPCGSAWTVRMDFATQDQEFTDALIPKRLQQCGCLLQGDPRTAWIGSEMTVAATVKTLVSRNKCKGGTIGDGDQLASPHLTLPLASASCNQLGIMTDFWIQSSFHNLKPRSRPKGHHRSQNWQRHSGHRLNYLTCPLTSIPV